MVKLILFELWRILKMHEGFPKIFQIGNDSKICKNLAKSEQKVENIHKIHKTRENLNFAFNLNN